MDNLQQILNIFDLVLRSEQQRIPSMSQSQSNSEEFVSLKISLEAIQTFFECVNNHQKLLCNTELFCPKLRESQSKMRSID